MGCGLSGNRQKSVMYGKIEHTELTVHLLKYKQATLLEKHLVTSRGGVKTGKESVAIDFPWFHNQSPLRQVCALFHMQDTQNNLTQKKAPPPRENGLPSQTSLCHKISCHFVLPKHSQVLHCRPQLNIPGELDQGGKVQLEQRGSFIVLFLQKTK